MASPTDKADARRARQVERTNRGLNEMAKSWGAGAVLCFVVLAIGAISKTLVLPFLVLVLLVGVPWAIRQRSRS